MFFGLENTQKEVSEELELLFDGKKFPYSSLFYGPSCCGKMYAAMSCARAFYADTDATIIISDRNFSYRIKTAFKLLKTERNKVSKEFLIDTAQVFLKQYHGALLDNQSANGKKKFSDAGICAELLEELKSATDENLLSISDKLEKELISLADINKNSVISVNQIRSIRDWARESTVDGKPKFVIIEGLENSTDSVSNALLKILEEPPLDTFFIILSENPGRIPATILSRVRKFAFNALEKEGRSFVLNKLFVNPYEFEDLESFFVSYSGVNDKLLKEAATLITKKEQFDMNSVVAELEKTNSWDRFFKLLVSELGAMALQCADSRRYEFLIHEINEIVSKGKSFNQTRRMTFDFVVYRSFEVLL